MTNKTIYLLIILLGIFNLNAQTTSIPDVAFEQYLIDANIDSDGTINGEVLTSDIISVSTLNVSDYNISDFQGLQFFSALTEFNLTNNQPSNSFFVGFGGNPLIEKITILNAWNLSGVYGLLHDSLTDLTVSSGGSLFTYIDLSSSINLNTLSISVNGLSSLNLSANTKLTILDLKYSSLTSIDVSNLAELHTLQTINSQITSLDLSNNKKLTFLNSANGFLNYVNLKNGFNSLITFLDLNGNSALGCIQVDNVANANSASGWTKDAAASYQLSCTTPISDYPYVEDFESGAAGWTVKGSNTTWTLGTPANTRISGAASGNNAWITNSTGNYLNSENGWVESPVFDLSSLSSPDVQFSIWWNCESDYDGAVIQSSIDSGTSWQNVGAFGDDINWYNDNSLNALPGGQTDGWSGTNSFKWVTAIHSLSNLNGQANVIFRIAFSSDGSQQFNGFAFDLFRILDNPCYAGDDNNIETCNNQGSLDLNNYLSNGTNNSGTWESITSLSISVEGIVDLSSVESSTTERFKYIVETENGDCIDIAIIEVYIERFVSAGNDTEIETCSGVTEEEMFDALGVDQTGRDDGSWSPQLTDPDDVSQGDYTFTINQLHSECGDTSSAVISVVGFPLPDAGSSGDGDTEISPGSLNLNNLLFENTTKLSNDKSEINKVAFADTTAEPGGYWTAAGSDVVLDPPVIDFDDTEAGQYQYEFTYNVEGNCGDIASSNHTITVDVPGFAGGGGELIICKEEALSSEEEISAFEALLLDALTGIPNSPGEWTTNVTFGSAGEYTFTTFNGGEDTADVQVYLNSLKPKIYIQGAMLSPNSGEEQLMRDDLRVSGYLPTISPYSDDANCDSSVFNSIGNNAIVDWVFLELRDKNDNTQVIVTKSALLQRDGDIVDVDGTSSICFPGIIPDDYYLVIKHRNHLGIMTANPIAIAKSYIAIEIDFTDANNIITFGTNAQTAFGLPTNMLGMWAGDTNNDGRLNYLGSFSENPSIRSQVFNDPNNSLFGGPPLGTYASLGYFNTDIDLDGKTKYLGSSGGVISDVLSIRSNTFNNPSNSLFGGPPISTYVFIQQLPEGPND